MKNNTASIKKCNPQLPVLELSISLEEIDGN